MPSPNILHFTATHPDADVWPQVQQRIDALDGGHNLSHLYDNAGINSWHVYNNIRDTYNLAREKFLAGPWDYLLSIEYDVLVPPDALERLLALDADVAYGLYCWRHNKRWSPYLELSEWGGTSVSLRHDTAREHWGKTLDVAGVGLGITLIKRHVLESLSFRLLPGYEGNFANDWVFAMDCQRNRFVQRADMNVVCGHIDGAKVYWPTPENENLYHTSQLKEI
jgi:hypothetical protein